MRNTRIYAYVVWRLLTDRILPLDYGKAARVMGDRFRELNGQAGHAISLDNLIERCEELSARFERLLAHARAEQEDASPINEVMRRVSRRLVPLDYTLGDRFAHDPALQLGPVPALSDLTKLADLDPDSDPYRFLRSRLIRERNRVAVGLRDALELLGERLPGGET